MTIGCANATSNVLTADVACTIEEICGFGGFRTSSSTVIFPLSNPYSSLDGGEPDQWFRFITPIFLHAGIIHLLLNMFAQWFLSGQVEQDMGSAGFLILYFSAGIFGNVLGALAFSLHPFF
jgi:membrane associated rhomboid family serine protease